MKSYLQEFYNKDDMKMIEKAFGARINLQYYADRPVDNSVILEAKKYCKEFFVKTKDILARITEEQISQIRENLGKEME